MITITSKSEREYEVTDDQLIDGKLPIPLNLVFSVTFTDQAERPDFTIAIDTFPNLPFNRYRATKSQYRERQPISPKATVTWFGSDAQFALANWR